MAVRINKILYKIAITLLFTFIICGNSYASSWTDNEEKSIYEVYDEEQQSAVQKELEGLESVYTGVTGDVLGDLIGKLFITIGDGLYKIFAGMGFELNTIIYGRVGGSAYITNNVSLFTYELSSGNVYGIVSMALFNVLRSSFVLIMLCMLWFHLMAFIYSSGNARAREKLKDKVSTFIILLISLILLPKILDLFLYVRDTCLYAIMVRCDDLVKSVASAVNPSWVSDAGARLNLVGTFKEIVNNDPSFVNDGMYLGAVVVQFYFGLSYISAAVAMVILVIAFPFVCVLELKEHGSVGDWIKQVLGILINPIIDSCLLLIPMLFAVLGYDNNSVGYSFVALIVCGCIIPARGVIRVLMRLGNGMGLELAGLGAALGAMRLGTSIAKGIVGTAAKVKEGLASARSDEDLANLYNEQAQRLDLASINDEDDMSEGMSELLGDGAYSGFQKVNDLELEGMSPEERANARNENMRHGLDALDERKSNLTDEIKQEETRSSKISQEMADIDEHTAELKTEKALLDHKNPENFGAIRDIEQKIAENDIDKKKLSSEQAKIRSGNNYRKEQIGKIDALTNRTKNKIIGMRAGGVGSGLGYSHSGGMEHDEQNLLSKYANVENFEMPAFKNLSLERKADLYQKRARQTRLRTVGSASIGAIGGMTGAAVGFGGATFFSPAAKMYATSALMDTGGAAGNFAGAAIGSKISNIQMPRTRQSYKPIRTTTNNVSGYKEPLKLVIPEMSNVDYSDYDQEQRSYKRATNYTPNWSLPEEERYKYENALRGIMSSVDSNSVNHQIKRTMREASVVARQSRNAIKMGGEIPMTEAERSEVNRVIVEEALDSFSRSMSENILLSEKYVEKSEDMNLDEFGKYIEERFANSSRNQIKSYLKSKGILF